MSYARGFGLNGKSIYENVAKPSLVNLKFTVDSANANGLGVSSVKSNGYVESVFMHTSQTPGSMNGFLNPNPAAGFLLVQFKNNFNFYLSALPSIAPPTAGSALTSVTANVTYVINALGTATLAQWQAKGFPAGFTPALGAAFVATATGTIGGSASVKVPSVSAVTGMEVVGDPAQMIANSAIGANAGARIIMQYLGPTINTGAYVVPMIPTAPADGSVVSLMFKYDGSTVTVDGL